VCSDQLHILYTWVFCFLHITCNRQNINVCVLQCSKSKYYILLHKPALHIIKQASQFCVIFKSDHYTTERIRCMLQTWLSTVNISSVQVSFHAVNYARSLVTGFCHLRATLWSRNFWNQFRQFHVPEKRTPQVHDCEELRTLGLF
jgi:hypothetical protein